MQTFTLHDLVNRTMLGDEKFYDAREVDPRIDELVAALKSAAHVLKKMRSEAGSIDRLACEALREADKALSL